MRDGKNWGEMLWDGRFEKLAGLITLTTGIKPQNLLSANLLPAGDKGPLEWGKTFFTSMENCEDAMFKMSMQKCTYIFWVTSIQDSNSIVVLLE